MSPRRRFRQPPKRDIQEVERAYPAQDTVARSLSAKTHYGSIQDIEEKRFPWLKKRRGR